MRSPKLAKQGNHRGGKDSKPVMEQLSEDPCLLRTRRHLFRDCAVGLGGLALTSLLAEDSQAAVKGARGVHFPAKAKRVIYMHMAGGPSQIDMFDPKPS